uniref:Uncharacterized protein n=1 Tax=Tetranychus urticae TaxID=32264 RepID=T1KWY5_TETUR
MIPTLIANAFVPILKTDYNEDGEK